MRPAAFILCLLFGTAAVRPPHATAQENPRPDGAAVDFLKDVQPILANNCYECHGPAKQRGGLRLNAKAVFFKGGASGSAIIAGNSGESLLIKRTLGLGDEKRMPLDRPPLSDEQIKILRTWIDQGASWPDSASNDDITHAPHWAYLKPATPPLPPVKNEKWGRNPIDRFILAQLEKEGLSPSPVADRATLLRRVSLDLIGLPPTPAQIDQFLADSGPAAYEKIVDELLASPHYGEKWARPWLDLARYADSNGYEKDRLRLMWPYRDWVINALNHDMPFDQFTLEQIAGDLLPEATLEQKIASGFHRNTQLNEEGGVDIEEYRNLVVVDRVNTTATVWLGTTLGCAQCHNHKFDPFSQKEYYQFFAFFNHTAEETQHTDINDVIENSPKLPVPRPGEAELQKQIAAVEAQLRDPSPELDAAQAAWEERMSGAVAWTVLDAQSVSSTNGATLIGKEDGSILVGGATPETDTYTLNIETDLTGITAFRVEALADPDLPANGPGRVAHGNFVLSEFRVTTAPKAEDATPIAVEWQTPAADHNQASENGAYTAAYSLDGKPETGWAIVPETGKSHFAIFPTKTPVGFTGGTRLTIVLEQNFGHRHTIGRFRISATTDARDPRRATLPAPFREILARPPQERDAVQKAQLGIYFRSTAPQLQPLRDELAELRRKLGTPVTTLVMRELPQPRETHILLRGNFMNKGERVEPDVPKALSPLPPDQPHNRIGLARWLVNEENPLVGRVTMNRLWEQYFGYGLVQTSEDFGTQGAPPTHPELLDWLATEFARQQWSLKAMHRLIVTSAAYRQASAISPLLLEKDPYNHWLARGPRFRLEAELIRDQALAVSGLLSEKMGGPSVFPQQPDGIWANPYSGAQWMTSPGEDRYRRGIYTFWRRSAPYPSFNTFDAPTRETICPRRPRTNTALQALTTLNDPTFVQPAAALARRIVREGGRDAKERLRYAFRVCLIRAPRPEEANRLLALYEQQFENFKKDAQAAAQLAGGGPEAPSSDTDPAELAAWTVVANVLLNLDEMLTKG